MAVLEICVDSLESAIVAELGGADRVELCSSFIEGGITPSLGMIRAVRAALTIGVHVLIRPRAGDFYYSQEEVRIMKDDIALAAQCGVEGVVLGLLTKDGDIDVERTRDLVQVAQPMKVTFHRAIDMTRDIEAALRDVLETGVNRVLSSGGKPDALRGCHRLHDLVQLAAGRIAIMAGGNVRTENVCELADTSGIVEFHASLRRLVSSPMTHQQGGVHLGSAELDDYARSVVLQEDVRELRQAIDAACPAPPDGLNLIRRENG